MKFIKLKLLASVFFVSFVFAQDEAVEEVVVTGSFIKGSATDGASPVEIVSRDTIEVLGATTIADITANFQLTLVLKIILIHLHKVLLKVLQMLT